MAQISPTITAMLTARNRRLRTKAPGWWKRGFPIDISVPSRRFKAGWGLCPSSWVRSGVCSIVPSRPGFDCPARAGASAAKPGSNPSAGKAAEISARYLLKRHWKQAIMSSVRKPRAANVPATTSMTLLDSCITAQSCARWAAKACCMLCNPLDKASAFCAAASLAS